MKLLFELTKDGSISVPALSKKLGINASVLYSRIKRLMKKKLIKKFTVVIDDSLLGIGVKASVGVNRDPKFKDSIHKKLMETPEVVSISEVTGRFDIIVKVYADPIRHGNWAEAKPTDGVTRWKMLLLTRNILTKYLDHELPGE